MARIKYRDVSLKPATLAIVQRANAIIADWAAQGYDLTLRQLYYQFVSRGWIENKDTEYKRLGSIINDARYAGLVDWQAITDRTRNLRTNSHWRSPSHILQAVAQQYQIDKWAAQPYRPEVWVEKDALVGIVGQACEALDVPFFSCRGYTSASEVWAAAQRLRGYDRDGHEPVIFHLGDHDPSGVDMSRDIEARLSEFCGFAVDVRRIALTMQQVEQYDPPPNPAKLTDSRCTGYIDLYGAESWELDALEPSVMSELIASHVNQIRSHGEWEASEAEEEAERAELVKASTRWESVRDYLKELSE